MRRGAAPSLRCGAPRRHDVQANESLASTPYRAVLLALVAVVATLALGACGGDDSGNEREAEALLDRAFAKSISSADLKMDAQLEIRGLQGLEGPIRLDASGPFQSGDGELPKLDIDVSVGAQDAGQTVQTGLLSTGDRAFLKFGGEFYEQPPADIARANRQLEQSEGKESESALSQLGVEAARVGVRRAHGGRGRGGRGPDRARVGQARRAAHAHRPQQGGRALGRGRGRRDARHARSRSTDEQLDKLAAAVKEPTFDVYVGKDDDVIRRVSANLEVSVPEADRAQAGGIEGGSLRFSVEFADVNGDQTVKAPAKARPIADLPSQLGGLERARRRRLGLRRPGRTRPRSSQGYEECLNNAPPGDTEALTRCAELLR